MMPTVYFKTDMNFDPDMSNTEYLKYYLNVVVREVIECLKLNGVNFVYNGNPRIPGNAIEIILKVNPVQDSSPCTKRGVFIFFTPGDPNSKRLATSISKNIRNIYIDASLVKMVAQKPENDPPMSSVAIGICYANIFEDLLWLRENMEQLAKSIVMSILEYFGLPFSQCQKSFFGFTKQATNIMKRPTLNSEIAGSLKANTKVKLIGQWENWYIVFYDDNLGYVQTKFIST